MKNQIFEEIADEESNVKNKKPGYFSDTKDMCINGDQPTSALLNHYFPVFQKKLFNGFINNNQNFHHKNKFKFNGSNVESVNDLESSSKSSNSHFSVFSCQNTNTNSQRSFSEESISSPISQNFNSCTHNLLNIQHQTSNITPSKLQSQLNLSQQEKMMLLFQQYMIQNSSSLFNQLLQPTQNPSLMLNKLQQINHNAILNTADNFHHPVEYSQQHLFRQKSQCNNLKKVVTILNKFLKKLKQDLSKNQNESSLKRENSELEKKINSIVYANNDHKNENECEKFNKNDDLEICYENNDYLGARCDMKEDKNDSDLKKDNIPNIDEFSLEQYDSDLEGKDLENAEFSVIGRKDSVEEEGWSCGACTFINHALINECEVCEMPKL